MLWRLRSAKGQDELFGPGSTAHLKRRTVGGGAVTVVAQGGKFVLQMASTMVLARVLVPSDFGLVAMVAAITALLSVIKDAGLSVATIQRAYITEQQVSNLFWANIVLGVSLAVLAVAVSPLVAAFYREPRLQMIMTVSAATFISSAFTAQHQALLRRTLRLGTAAFIDIISKALGVVAGVAIALRTGSYWALVAMALVTSLSTMVMVWIAVPWFPGRFRRGHGFKSLLKFGGLFTGGNLLDYLFRNADNVLIGWVWGANALGFYTKAYSLLMLPIQQINAPVSGVAIPTLSRIQDEPGRFRKYFEGGYSVIASIVVPLTLGMFIFADELVLIVLGAQWEDSVSLFRFLAPAAMAGALLNPLGWLFITTGRMQQRFLSSVVWTVLVVAVFCITVPYGTRALALAYSVTTLVLAVPLCAYAKQGTAVGWREFGRALLHPVAASTVAGVVAILSKAWVFDALPLLGRGLAGGSLYAAVYGGCLFVVFGKWRFYRELFAGLRRH